ncbi:hypothetical protein C5167_001285, partial [Papaver somniferum]
MGLLFEGKMARTICYHTLENAEKGQLYDDSIYLRTSGHGSEEYGCRYGCKRSNNTTLVPVNIH